MSTGPYLPADGGGDVPDPALEAHWNRLLGDQAAEHPTPSAPGPKSRPELFDLLNLLNQARQREASEAAPRRALPDGAQLGDKLRILGLLDAGGMGEVYVAWHPVLGCEVAVKVLPADLVHNPDAVARFRRAIQTQARTGGHEHIVTTMDAGEDQGRPYLVMEYVPGINLKDYVVQRGPLSWPEAARYLLQAAEGLHHAHAQGIVHRDIKPANLVLSPTGKVKVLDWGLARLRDQEALTQSGMLLGTPNYMAPEQAQDPSRADPRSDLFSLGCTLYYLLTGHAPAADGVPDRVSVAQGLRRRGRSIPGGGVSILARLLRPRPEQRYSSAQALIDALDAASSPRRRWVIRAGAAAAILVLVLLALKWVHPQPKAPDGNLAMQAPAENQPTGAPPLAAEQPPVSPRDRLPDQAMELLRGATVRLGVEVPAVDFYDSLLGLQLGHGFRPRQDDTSLQMTLEMALARHRFEASTPRGIHQPPGLMAPMLRGARVQRPRFSGSGAGFLIEVNGNTGYLVTHRHVIQPEVEVEVYASGASVIHKKLPAPDARLFVDLESVGGQKPSVPAFLAGAFPALDVAILRISLPGGLPAPVAWSDMPDVTPSSRVWVIGWPASPGAILPSAQPGTVVNVAKNAQREVVNVQITGTWDFQHDGALVVDAHGRLVGLAQIKGNAGRVLPTTQLRLLLNGQPSGYHWFDVARSEDGKLMVNVKFGFFDPLKRVQSATFHYIPAATLKNKPGGKGDIAGLAEAKTVELAPQNLTGIAEGRFLVPVPEGGEVPIGWQVVYVNGAGQNFTTEVGAYTVKTPPVPSKKDFVGPPAPPP
jgi:S1-C subfamily serine protease